MFSSKSEFFEQKLKIRGGIVSLNDEYLQFRWLERGGVTLFKKK